MHNSKHPLKPFIFVFCAALLGAILFVYSGVYNMGADAPHWRPVFALLELFRDRSIAAHARGTKIPTLETPELIAEGAEHYAAMCSSCHLAPGTGNSEIRAGLYPQPPNLSLPAHIDPAEAFWIIKHGIKMTAMPAWGTSHDDNAIWALVAFVEMLPTLSEAQYVTITGGVHPHANHHHGDTREGGHPPEGEMGNASP
jgi:mono/diheme cytochrome c family protein